MQNSIERPEVTKLLNHLYEDAAQNDSRRRQTVAAADATDAREYFAARREIYMPVNREFGNLLYSLVRSTRAKTVVEFGTSFGVSTLFLAAGVRDHGGGGRVITTEFFEDKTDRARTNLRSAGLEELVDFRVGDALESLRTDPAAPIDVVLLDGAKHLYLDVLRLLEPRLRPGAIVAADNTDHSGIEKYMEYIRNPQNGYLSSGFNTRQGQTNIQGHEVSLRLG